MQATWRGLGGLWRLAASSDCSKEIPIAGAQCRCWMGRWEPSTLSSQQAAAWAGRLPGPASHPTSLQLHTRQLPGEPRPALQRAQRAMHPFCTL